MCGAARLPAGTGEPAPIRPVGFGNVPTRRTASVTAKLLLLGTLVLSLGSAGTALAQSPARTGTGGDVSTTTRAPNTTSVGQTKPPGAAGGEADRNAEERTQQQKKDNAITKGICIGCN